MRRHEQEQMAARSQPCVNYPERLDVAADVLEHVEADRGVERRFVRGQLGGRALKHRYAVVVREARTQHAGLLGIRLQRDDILCEPCQLDGERPDPGADVEDARADVRPGTLEQPRVVVGREAHPIELRTAVRLGTGETMFPP